MIKLPDSPKDSPWLQKIQYLTDPIGYLEKNYQRYGDIFNAPIFGDSEQQLLVSHPQGLKELLARDGKEIYTPSNKFLQFTLGEKSVSCVEGKAHQRERKLLLPPLQGKNITVYGQTICQLTEQVLSQLTPGTTFSASRVAQEIVLGLIIKIIFGVYDEKCSGQFKQLMTEFLNSFESPLIYSAFFLPFLRKDLGAWSPWGYFLRLQQKVDELLYGEIRDRRAQDNSERTDILSLLLSAVDEEGNPTSDRQLRDELITLVVAGRETTSISTSWALYWIHSFPEVRDKLLQELETLGDRPDPMAIFKLPYLTAVCNESLRMYPVVPIILPRELKEPVELMGYKLEAGTQVYGSIYLTHHREDLYPESKKFKPERFLERKYTPYEFLPFGGGSRRCLGENLAIFQMKLILATILKNYRLALVSDQLVKPQIQGFNIAPSGGVKMVLEEKPKT